MNFTNMHAFKSFISMFLSSLIKPEMLEFRTRNLVLNVVAVALDWEVKNNAEKCHNQNILGLLHTLPSYKK